jgi:hypothetical protein
MALEASGTYGPAADLVILILSIVVISINMASKIEDLSLRVRLHGAGHSLGSLDDELVCALMPPTMVTNISALRDLGAGSISGKDSTLVRELEPVGRWGGRNLAGGQNGRKNGRDILHFKRVCRAIYDHKTKATVNE